MQPARRLEGIEISLIRQINALASPTSINLGIGEPNVQPDDTLREMAARAAAGRWSYSPNAGFLSLREALVAERAPSRDASSEICVTAGTQEALFSIVQAYVDPGDEVLVPDPGFVAYATLARLAGATAVPYRLEPPAWDLHAEEIAGRITPRTKLIVINSPSNPLGSIVSRSALEQVAAIARDRNVLVIVDQVYRDLWYDFPTPSSEGLGANVIVVDGFSKSHSMTGLRIGWIIADAAVLKPVVTAHQYIATCASVFSQRLAEDVLRNRDWNARWLEHVRSTFRRQRDTALESLNSELGTPVDPPAGAFYLFVPMPSCDTLGFARTLAKEADVLVIPGSAFGTNGEGFVRISYAADGDRISEGIRRIARWMGTRGR